MFQFIQILDLVFVLNLTNPFSRYNSSLSSSSSGIRPQVQIDILPIRQCLPMCTHTFQYGVCTPKEWHVGDGLCRMSGFDQLAHASAVLERSTVTLPNIHHRNCILPAHKVIWDDKRKEMLVVLAFTFIIHTFPGLEHSSPFPCRDIRLIIGPRLDLYLPPRLHPRTTSPSVIYLNAQSNHFYGLSSRICFDSLRPTFFQ
ncbi:hypothetical protein EV424DRAFT_986074 [Suillus variegatus]|nr:hypothetical protein EV424DRAFT_986074 [Suillus variegatus]